MSLVEFPHPALCIVQFPRGFDADILRELITDIQAKHDGKTLYGVIGDMGQLTPQDVGSSIRHSSAVTLRSFHDQLSRFGVCEARFVRSAIVRAALTVFDWATPVGWERGTFATGDLAESWVRAKLRNRSVELPPERFFTPPTKRHSA